MVDDPGAMSAPEPTPEELASAFDCGSWAAVRSLVVVLHKRGILDAEAFEDLLGEMAAVHLGHGERGEVHRAEAVQIAAEELAGLVRPLPE